MANDRVRRSAAERRELISRWEKSGLSGAQFCRREQIRLSSFRRWRRNGQAGSGRSEFVELTPPLPAPSSWTLEIWLPNGCHLRFQG